MKAVGYLHSHPIRQPEALMDIHLPIPLATGNDLLVKVKAISVNPVDAKIRASLSTKDGEYKVLGWDAAGEVIAAGDDTQLFKVGDEVWYAGDLTRQGSYAEYQLVDERIVGHKPKSLSFAEAAALPLTTITAWETLFDRFEFTPCLPRKGNHRQRPDHPRKHCILIVGAGGGVGSILTQLAAQLTDALVIGTASRPQTQVWVKKLGAHHVIDHRTPLQPQLEQLALSNVTHVASLSHTEQHYNELVELLAPQGKLALIDDLESPVDILKMKQKSLSLHWEFMYTRSMFNTWDMEKQHQLLSTVATLIDKDIIQTTKCNHYGKINAENLRHAHTLIESHHAMGKIVLEGFE